MFSTLALCAGLLATACDDTSENSPDVDALVDYVVFVAEDTNDSFRDFCRRCIEPGSREACREGLQTIAVDRACLTNAFSLDPKAVEASVECERPAVDSLGDCMDDAVDACDPDALTACGQIQEPECDLEPDLEREIQACYSTE